MEEQFAQESKMVDADAAALSGLISNNEAKLLSAWLRSLLGAESRKPICKPICKPIVICESSSTP